MGASVQDTSGYYVWKAEGQPVEIHLHLDVLDRLAAEVMRGFGAVPKRGAEVGGVLIGTIDGSVVRIEDFEPVECAYKRGPSYLFTEEEKANFEDAVQRWQPGSAKPAYAVGFYRSQTRDGMSLAPEDIELLNEFFPDAEQIALLVKPYGTKVSEAGFFVREDGSFPEKSPMEFPFRRRELTGEEPPPHRSMMERDPERRPPRQRNVRSIAPPMESAPVERAPMGRGFDRSLGERSVNERSLAPIGEPDEEYSTEPDRMRAAMGPAYATTLPSRSRIRSSIWIPLSFVFLLFGVALGLMVSFARSQKPMGDPQDFELGLSISKSGDNLSVRWDRRAPAIQAAQNGQIEFEENGKTTPKDLDSADLQSGSMIYTNSSNRVKVTLKVFPRAHVAVEESAEWRP